MDLVDTTYQRVYQEAEITKGSAQQLYGPTNFQDPHERKRLDDSIAKQQLDTYEGNSMQEEHKHQVDLLKKRVDNLERQSCKHAQMLKQLEQDHELLKERVDSLEGQLKQQLGQFSRFLDTLRQLVHDGRYGKAYFADEVISSFQTTSIGFQIVLIASSLNQLKYSSGKNKERSSSGIDRHEHQETQDGDRLIQSTHIREVQKRIGDGKRSLGGRNRNEDQQKKNHIAGIQRVTRGVRNDRKGPIREQAFMKTTGDDAKIERVLARMLEGQDDEDPLDTTTSQKGSST
ncbi:MAG: hypothetical protein Q9220_007723 [cf. Caloplaca sp. 1 TL-2023]